MTQNIIKLSPEALKERLRRELISAPRFLATNRGLRVGDAERDETTRELAAQCSLGRLTPAEFESRMSIALRATYEGQLANLTQDLPPLPPPPNPPDTSDPLDTETSTSPLTFVTSVFMIVALLLGIIVALPMGLRWAEHNSDNYQSNQASMSEAYAREHLIQESTVPRFTGISHPRAVICYGGKMTEIPGSANTMDVQMYLKSEERFHAWIVAPRKQAHKMVGKTC